MVDGIDGFLGLFHRPAGLPVDPRLVRLAHADAALRRMRPLEAGEQTAMTHILVALAVAIHLVESIGHEARLIVSIADLRVWEESRIENGRGQTAIGCRWSSDDDGARCLGLKAGGSVRRRHRWRIGRGCGLFNH